MQRRITFFRSATAVLGLSATLLVSSLATSWPALASEAPEPELASSGSPVLAATPPMGWNSWNKFGCGVTEDIVKGVIDAIASNGMKDAGYQYITVDDCWMAPSRGADGVLQADPGKFPGGMKALADYAHAAGLKFGLYQSPTQGTCQKRPGSYGFEKLDAQTFASWGVDFLKYDWCQTSKSESPQMWADNPGVTEQELAKKLFTRMSDELKAASRPTVYSLSACCSALSFEKWAGDVSNMWRTSTDIYNSWNSLMYNYGSAVDKAAYAGPGKWNDPDMLQVGNTEPGGTGLTFEENKTHMALWAMMAAPLIAGNDVRSASAQTTALLTNPRIVAIDQDPLGKAAERVRNQSGIEVLTRPLSGDRTAVLILNTGSTPKNVQVPFSEVRVSGAVAALTEAWGGASSWAVGAINTTVPGHGAAIYIAKKVF